MAVIDASPIRRALTTRKRLRRDEQDLVHRPLVEHVRRRSVPGLLCWHTPNGGGRSRTEAAILQGLGVRAGIPDLLFFRKGRLYGVECKVPGGTLTAAQSACLTELAAQGCEVVVVDNVMSGLRWLEDRGLIRGRTT